MGFRKGLRVDSIVSDLVGDAHLWGLRQVV